MWINWNTCTIAGGNVNGVATIKWYGSFSKKLKIELPYDSAILLMGIY